MIEKMKIRMVLNSMFIAFFIIIVIVVLALFAGHMQEFVYIDF